MSENAQLASFRFLNYIVEKSDFSISGPVISNEMEMNLELGLILNTDSSSHKLSIYADIKDKGENLSFKVMLAGFFNSENCTEQQRNKFLCFNAPAILFPYLRAFVSSVTGQAGITPVIIPTINLMSDGEKLLKSLDV